MKKGKLASCFAVLAMAASIATASAQVLPHESRIVDTKHSVTIHGKNMTYVAHTGLLPLYVNDTGELAGNIFITAYIANRQPDSPPRPLTFLWNGGPGSNSAQVHIVGFGPKRVTTADTFTEWGQNTETPIIDHEESWFDTSDLVFIDPPGTGFSRATSKEFRDILYTGRGDAEAVAEAIRVFLTRYEMWDRPLFIGGESYGTTRAMLVAEALEKRRTHLKGVILISGGYDTGQKLKRTTSEALNITLFTETAYFHKRLEPDLQALSSTEAVARAESWARTTYAPALARVDALTETERGIILAGLKRFTGLDPKFIDKGKLVIDSDVYSDNLLADQSMELGRYDRRMVLKKRASGAFWMPWDDPSLLPMRDLMEGTSRVFNTYVRKDLGFESDLLYRGPFGKSFHPEPLTVDPVNGFSSDWMAQMFKYNDRDPAAPAPLRVAMDLNEALMVMNVRGNFDQSCSALDEAVAQSDPLIRRRVVNYCVVGGHMFYSDVAARRALQKDFRAFVNKSLAQ
ncbi:Carboxypeptidase C (cathepsin A) [Sphingobium sp. AP50]|uniref:S10 family serine carboxypeptidase-like protein n=1 Tax=Sphingobium sp. AP50 TaxID=1884369 RepID=UPI0008AF8AEA|nr:hypothetical protein [Sphingobium sp. AP50]SEJ98420.1 Carboxypeptidase C (cathepsin A) [Sphingobium sp. AP50]